MPAFTFVRTDKYIEDLHHGVHNFSADQLMIALSNQVPNVSTMAVLGDVTEVAYTNLQGNPDIRELTVTGSEQVEGIYTLKLADVTLVASGGNVGPLQYVWVYNSSPVSPVNPLIAYLAYPEPTTIRDGEPFVLNFSELNGIMSVT